MQTRPRAFPSDTPTLLSVTQLGDAVLPRQWITAATIHIKDDPSGFFGHISICGERNNWVGLNHVRVLNIGKSPLSRLRSWLDPVCLAQLHRIQTLTLGLLKFTSDEVQSVGVLLLLEELKPHPYDSPELTRSHAHYTKGEETVHLEWWWSEGGCCGKRLRRSYLSYHTLNPSNTYVMFIFCIIYSQLDSDIVVEFSPFPTKSYLLSFPSPSSSVAAVRQLPSSRNVPS